MSKTIAFKKIKEFSIVLLTIVLTFSFGLGTETIIMVLMNM